jgi:NAD(P)H-flavin reductase
LFVVPYLTKKTFLLSFKAGDYISINLPLIALYEYHPFTISSAPEEMSYLSVHIQASGDWTKRIYQRFKDMSDNQSVENDLTIHRADLNVDQATAEERQERETIHREEEEDDENERIVPESRARTEVVIMKGPYSSCARCIFDCKHVILIGGGIGITPYASILQSLMAQFRASRIICKHCQSINYNRRDMGENRSLKKVDFIWVNRNHKNFEWFLNLLHEFEREQETYLKLNIDERRFLDIHLYFTGIKCDENVGDIPSDLITNVWTQVAGHDVFAALKSKTHIGQPKWNELFQSFKSGENTSTANDVSVFFCGPPSMGIDIRKYCTDYRFRYFEEKF